MKFKINNLIAIIPLLFDVVFLCGQTVTSSCAAPASVAAMYEDDADKLAVNYVISNSLPYKDSIKIDKVNSKYYLNALLAVYNATALPARDTVILLRIHSTLYYVFNNIMFADAPSSYMTNLKNNVTPTGNTPFDSLASKYYLKLSQYFAGGSLSGDLVTLKSDTNFNATALYKAFNNFVFHSNKAKLNNIFSDGSRLTDVRTTNYVELTYSYGWQDCMDGCDYRRQWVFRIYNDCSVAYVGSSGDYLPSVELYSGLQENKRMEKAFRVFPNPTNGEFTISLEQEFNGQLTFKVTNLLGEQISSGTLLEQSGYKIYLTDLPNGVYFLNILDNNKPLFTQKIIRHN